MTLHLTPDAQNRRLLSQIGSVQGGVRPVEADNFS